MSVHKDERKTGTWFAHIRYTDWTGQRRQHRKRGFPTKREALEYERNFLSKQSCTGLTMKALYDLYMEDLAHRLTKTSSLVTIRYRLDKAMRYLQDLKVEQVTPQIIRKIQYNLKEAGFSNWTVKSAISTLSSMFNYGIKYMGLSSNPCHIAGSVLKAEYREMTIWTEDEFEQFRAAVNPNFITLFSVLFYTGLRIGELLALTWADIDGNILHITKTYDSQTGGVTTPKTPNAVRDITIPDFIVDLLAIRPLTYSPDDRVFPRAPSTIRYTLIKGAQKADIPVIRVHDLRHSHASNLIAAGVPITAVSRRLGHANPNITLQVYAHALQNDDANIARLLDEKRGPRRAP